MTAYFILCQKDEFATTLLYEEIPSRQEIIQRRRRGTPTDGYPGIFCEHTLRRVYTVYPNNHECFYIRVLLHVIGGPTSFESLKVSTVLYTQHIRRHV